MAAFIYHCVRYHIATSNLDLLVVMLSESTWSFNMNTVVTFCELLIFLYCFSSAFIAFRFDLTFYTSLSHALV